MIKKEKVIAAVNRYFGSELASLPTIDMDGRKVKLTIDLPDTTTAVAVTYVYVEGGGVMLANRLLDTADIDGQREET